MGMRTFKYPIYHEKRVKLERNTADWINTDLVLKLLAFIVHLNGCLDTLVIIA